ncbi:MAG: fibronectin type III domain-containing protein [Cyclobacteriaceae bacterium]
MAQGYTKHHIAPDFRELLSIGRYKGSLYLVKFFTIAIILLGCDADDYSEQSSDFSDIQSDAQYAIPSIRAIEIIEITRSTMAAQFLIEDTGGTSIISYGICWSTSSEPQIDENFKLSTTLSEILTIEELEPNTTYYIRGFASNDTGLAYSNELEFKTEM